MDFFISNAYAQAGAGAGSSIMGILPLLLMLPIFYFLMIRPQQKRMKEHKAMVAALKKGDQVVTNGGLGGVVTKVEEAFLTVRISEGVEVYIQSQSIAALLPNGTLKSI